MRPVRNQPTHVTSGNVLEDLGFTPEQTAALKFKAELYRAFLRVARKYPQGELQTTLGKSGLKVGKLLNGKIADISVGKLHHCCLRLGVS